MQNEIRSLLDKAWESEDFLFSALAYVLPKEKSELSSLWDLQEEMRLSFAMDRSKLQDGSLFRLQRRARLTAEHLISEHGELHKEKVASLIRLFDTKGHIPYPGGFFDEIFLRHMIKILWELEKDGLYEKIKKFHMPLCGKFAEDLVRDTLGLVRGEPITDKEVRVAVLSACLTALRQNVGSCFATAPAIRIQQEQTSLFLDDLYQLLKEGKLTRICRGKESQVPLSPTFGAGDLHRKVSPEKHLKALCKAPGLVDAFALIDISAEEMERLFASLQLSGFLSVGQLIHKALLKYFSITEDDISAHAKVEKSLARSAGELGSLTAHLSQGKMQLVEQMEEKEKRVKAAFKAKTDHPLLKAWEFSLASFAEVKMEFSRWNLFASLGLSEKEEGGIGEVIYQSLDVELSANNEKIEEYHEDYLLASDQLRATEALLKRAATKDEIHRLKVEFDSRLYHLRSCEERRNEAHKKAELIAKFFPELIEKYHEKFQEYFQEIYDAEIHDAGLGQYEDSPAGFRLVYKHGRIDATLWDQIHTAKEYLEALTHFFQNTEPLLRAEIDESLEETLQEVTTKVIHHLQEQRFLETAILRMAKQHGETLTSDPLKSMESMEKKPWVYTSGGSMETLLEMYYQREEPVALEGRWVDSSTDLLTHVINVLKALPAFEERSSFLMSSPTHAFLLHPDFSLLAKGWKSNVFTYSWIRDEIIFPRKKRYESLELSLSEQSFLLEKLLAELPQELANQLKPAVTAEGSSVKAFRSRLVKAFQGGVVAEEMIDSLLYESLPLLPATRVQEALSKLTKGAKYLFELGAPASSFVTAKELQEVATALQVFSEESCFFREDLHRLIRQRGEKEGIFVMPPLFFADTNWPSNYFGFVLNPGTNELELWRLDPLGCAGTPMHSWRSYLNGKEQKLWNIYTNPWQYT